MNLIDKIDAAAGLGNPGPKYRDTYHNAGRFFIDFLSEDAEWEKRDFFEFAEVAVGSRDIFLIRPLVFMNDSGKAIKSALKLLRIKSSRLLVAHDDTDLPLGKFRISIGRGSAGHRGVESIQVFLRRNDFIRLRFGTRGRGGKAGDFVLNKILPDDKAMLIRAFRSARREFNPTLS